MDKKTHWTAFYIEKKVKDHDWFEEIPEQSLKIIRSLNLSKYAEIINVGSGTSTLIEHLLEDGYQNITVNDISATAFETLKNQLGKEECNVEWMLDDLTEPTVLKELPLIDLWHDRGVLHFFTEEKERLSYFNLLKQKVKSNGFVIIAVFNKNGPKDYAELPTFTYDEPMLSMRLGFDFELKQSFNYTFINSNGEERPYIYTLYQRK